MIPEITITCSTGKVFINNITVEQYKKYNFTVQDTARQQNWNVPVFTLRSAIALAVLAVIAAGVIWLLVFLWGVLARRKARKAAEAQKEEKNEEDSNKKES